MKLKILSLTILTIILFSSINIVDATEPVSQKYTYFNLKGYILHRWTKEKINLKHGQDLFRKSDGGLSLHPVVRTNNGNEKKEKIYYELYTSNNTCIQSGSFIPTGFHIGFVIDSYLPVGRYRIRLTYYGNEKKGLLPYYEDINLIITPA
jgi:hypothetical protein